MTDMELAEEIERVPNRMIDAITPRERLRCVAQECWSWKLALCFIAAACILGLMLSGCWVEPQKMDVERVLDEQGFTNISDVKPIFFGCDQNDAFRYSFKAISPRGHKVSGYVCSSIFKAWTVRIN